MNDRAGREHGQERVIELLERVVLAKCRVAPRATQEIGRDQPQVAGVPAVEPHRSTLAAARRNDDVQDEEGNKDDGGDFVDHEPRALAE